MLLSNLFSRSRTDVVVIGAGIGGLSSALTLAQNGFKVTVIARDLPGDQSLDWASPWAGAAILLYPSDGHEHAERDRKIQTESFKWYWALAHRDPTSSVQVVDTTEYYDDQEDDKRLWYKSIVPGYRLIPKAELPEGSKVGIKYRTMCLDPDRFLPWLQTELESLGVKFIRKTVKSFQEAQSLAGAKVVVNCAGLGARELAGDTDMVSVRGQTMLVKSDFKDLLLRQGGAEYTMAIPRMFTGGVIIGGIRQVGSTDTQVDVNLKKDILSRINILTKGAFADIDLERDVIKDIVGFRPERSSGPRIEAEGSVIHAYGYGGLGYVFSFGAAACVKDMVMKRLGSKL